MIAYTGDIFESYENLGTSTNEIDLYLRVREKYFSLTLKYKSISLVDVPRFS